MEVNGATSLPQANQIHHQMMVKWLKNIYLGGSFHGVCDGRKQMGKGGRHLFLLKVNLTYHKFYFYYNCVQTKQ